MAKKSVFRLTQIAVFLVTGLLASRLFAQSTQNTTANAAPGAAASPSTASSAPAGTPYRNHPVRLSNRAVAYYQSVWGIDSLSVKWAESGEMIRFTYRVVDPKKAELLNDKKVEPHLIDPRAGVSLMVPTMEKVGQLRQTSTPETGRSYWMAFSNSGRPVKRGDHVDVVVGLFRADDLVVE
jgi:hypothetical protein